MMSVSPSGQAETAGYGKGVEPASPRWRNHVSTVARPTVSGYLPFKRSSASALSRDGGDLEPVRVADTSRLGTVLEPDSNSVILQHVHKLPSTLDQGLAFL